MMNSASAKPNSLSARLAGSSTSEGQTYAFGDGVAPHTLVGDSDTGYIPENEAAVNQMLSGLEAGDEGVCQAEP